MSTLAMMTSGCSMGYSPFLLAQGYSDVTNVFDLFFLVHVGHMMQFDSVLASASGRRGGLMVSALDSGASGPGSSPGRGHCVVFLGKTLYSHGAFLHPGV